MKRKAILVILLVSVLSLSLWAQASAEAPITGTMVPGDTLTEKLAWLQRSADSHNTYIMEISANENIAPHSFEYTGAINITIVLRGDEENRTLRLRSHGTMFTINRDVTFVLDNNITLHGHSGNNRPMVNVSGGTFRMRAGSTITGNPNSGDGGGVYLSNGTFEMSGGTISNNTANSGGGVHIGYGGTFTMSGGTISGNTAGHGGGVFLPRYSSATFNMRGGTITANTAREYGGGVCAWGAFNKTGGTITGYNTDQDEGNVVRDADDQILARRGHAAFVSETQRRETTAGARVNLSAANNTNWGQ